MKWSKSTEFSSKHIEKYGLLRVVMLELDVCIEELSKQIDIESEIILRSSRIEIIPNPMNEDRFLFRLNMETSSLLNYFPKKHWASIVDKLQNNQESSGEDER